MTLMKDAIMELMELGSKSVLKELSRFFPNMTDIEKIALIDWYTLGVKKNISEVTHGFHEKYGKFIEKLNFSNDNSHFLMKAKDEAEDLENMLMNQHKFSPKEIDGSLQAIKYYLDLIKIDGDK